MSALPRALVRALHAEALKLRGTLAAWMCLVAPATVAVLYLLQMTFMDYGKRPVMAPAVSCIHTPALAMRRRKRIRTITPTAMPIAMCWSSVAVLPVSLRHWPLPRRACVS